MRQARSIYVRDETRDKWKDTATVVLSHIQQKVIDRQNKLFDNKQIDYYIKEVMNITIRPHRLPNAYLCSKIR